MPTATTLNITLNGKARSVAVPDSSEFFLYTLRDRLDQLGPKFGCGVSQCGACTALVNGKEMRTCVHTVAEVPQGAEVTTLDGLARNAGQANEQLHPLQQAFIDEQAGQCAFCVNGMLMGSLAWLNRRFAAGRGAPSEDEIKTFLAGKELPIAPDADVYLCRCGAHSRIVRAIRRGALEMLK